MNYRYGPYSFDNFLEEIKNLDYFDIIKNAENRIMILEKASFSMKGSRKIRAAGSIIFSEKLKALIFFLRFGIKPASLDNDDFLKLKEITQILINKKQLKKSSLNLFKI